MIIIFSFVSSCIEYALSEDGVGGKQESNLYNAKNIGHDNLHFSVVDGNDVSYRFDSHGQNKMHFIYLVNFLKRTLSNFYKICTMYDVQQVEQETHKQVELINERGNL